MTKGGSVILRVYFSLVSFVTLMMLIFSVSDLINISLKTFIFTAADAPEWSTYCDPIQSEEVCARQQKNENHAAIVRKQQSAVRDIAMLIVSAPLFWIHFRIVYRDWIGEKKEEGKT